MFSINEIILILICLSGALLLVGGIRFSIYDKSLMLFHYKKDRRDQEGQIFKAIRIILDKFTSLPVVSSIHREFMLVLSIHGKHSDEVKFKSGIICLVIVCMPIGNMYLLKSVGQLWYTRLLVIILSIFLPYYIATLLADIYKDRVNRQIPKLIDEFRSAFIKHRKIKAALKDSGKFTGGVIGKSVEQVSHSTDVKDELILLKEGLNNVWFNIFIQLVINHKNNGGELIDQLYKLNKTMVLYNNLEKKKARRLIWYEIFSVGTAIISIPAVLWINYVILGSSGYIAADTQGNMIIFRIFCFTLISLLIMRVLRRM